MGDQGDGLKESFDAIASRYDEHRRWIIPDFAGFYSAAVEAADSPTGAPAILDIGAGTGLLSEMFLQVYPGAAITLMDISDKMLDVARERFGGRERVRFIVADYRDADLGGPYDLVTSALSIHHLAREEKRELYRHIFSSLRDGGIFVNADEAAGESEEIHARNIAAWDAFLLSGPLGETEARAIMARRERLDRMEKLPVQLEWLREIGFEGVRATYRNGCFVVFTGKKGRQGRKAG